MRPESGWLPTDWAGLWGYRDLLVLLVRRDFVAKYKQTILGPLWFIVQPLLTTIVFTLVFGKAVGLSTDGLPPLLFYLCGQLGWNYFSQTLTLNSTTLVANSALFNKVYFPRLVVPLASLISSLFAFVIELATFAAFYLYFKYGLHNVSFGVAPEVVLLPLLLLQTALLSLGVSLIVSAATAKYRDLTYAATLSTQLWMFLTPVIYPMSRFPAAWRWLLGLNPMAPIVEAYRRLLLGQGTVVPAHEVWSVAATTLLLAAGLLLFSKVEKNFVDVA